MPYSSKILFFAFVLVNSICCYSQIALEATTYYNNIIDIGQHDFALITGDDSENFYFVCVRSAEEVIESEIEGVKFYRSSFTSNARRINTFKFGSYNVVLYKCGKSKTTPWQKKYYSDPSVALNLSTFLDNGATDSIWSINRKEVFVNEIFSNGLLTIRVQNNADIDKGMPIISRSGGIVGIFAEASGNNLRTITAINLKTIADVLYKFGECKYFNMLEYGQTLNRCEIERGKKSVAIVNKSNRDRASKKHFIDFGLNASFAGALSDQSSSTEDGSKAGGFNYGVSFYLNVDNRGFNRITIKPRYGNFTESYSKGIWISPNNDFKITDSYYKYFEIPIFYERQIIRSKDFSMSLGAGYSPGFVSDHAYNFTYTRINTTGIQSIIAGKNTYHRIAAELNFFEWEILRLGLTASRDISNYPNSDYVLTLNNKNYTPFATHNKFWFFGLSLELRLRGVWGLPEK